MRYCIAAAGVEGSGCKVTLRASDLDSGSVLAQELAIVDAFVTKSVVALRRDYQAHTAPVHAASAAHAAVEAGTHAGACSWLARLLAICTFEGSQHATDPVAASWNADAAREHGVNARWLRLEETVRARKRRVLDAGAGAHVQVIKKKNKKQKTNRIGSSSEAETLKEKFKEHAQWALSNLDLLRSRKGSCFKEKLRQRHTAEETRIYQWLCNNVCELGPGGWLRKEMAIVDAWVTKSVAGKKK